MEVVYYKKKSGKFVFFCIRKLRPEELQSEGPNKSKYDQLPRLLCWIDAPCPSSKVGGMWHTCLCPGDRSVHLPGRFYAAAAPSFVPWACTQRVKSGPKRADCPAFHAGSMPRAPFPQQRPEASETPAGALGTTLCTYQSVRSSRRPVVLFPWRCTWKSRPKKPIALPLALD